MVFTEPIPAHFWRYQQMILEVVERKAGPGNLPHCRTRLRKDHRRPRTDPAFRAAAVVFAPTTTIQAQWQQKLAQF